MGNSLTILSCPPWQDYELLDSGGGAKLERYGSYVFSRPEPQAVWRAALPPARWQAAHAVFQPTQEESGGHWEFHQPVETSWVMRYGGLKFRAQTTAGRHLGLFPEQAAHWDWLSELIRRAGRPIQALNLFGYTGLATLAAARAGAQVTHVDASKKSVSWARENQALSGLEAAPVRWIVDDALKFIQREARRNKQYDAIILDPPKFGRGPHGEVWEFFKLFPDLLDGCRALLNAQPLFIVVTAYAIRASALSLYYPLEEMMRRFSGTTQAGELALIERSAGRALSTAIYARWQSNLLPPAA
jgi:23S rRNA (cytosine1962-C5)-methyltransferase